MRLVNVVVSLVLVGAGVGVVKPQSERLADEAWNPVATSLQSVDLVQGEQFDLATSGEYVVFAVGPANHTLWERASCLYLDVLDTRNSRPIPASVKDLEPYEYEREGTRTDAILELRVQTPGRFSLHFGPNDVVDLHRAGFSLSIGRAKLIGDQSLKARGFRYGGLGLAGLLVLIGVSTLFGKG